MSGEGRTAPGPLSASGDAPITALRTVVPRHRIGGQALPPGQPRTLFQLRAAWQAFAAMEASGHATGLTLAATALTRGRVPSAYERLGDLLRALSAEGVAYVLFGGQAVNPHGILRYTGDIDLFVDPAPDNTAALRRALRRVWDDPDIEEIRSEDLAGEYAVVRYGTPDDFVIDITARIEEAFAFGDIESETLVVADVPARVATARMLYRMKKDTLRPHDQADAAELKRKFRIEDE